MAGIKRRPTVKVSKKQLRLKGPSNGELFKEESEFPTAPALHRTASMSELLKDQISKRTRTRSGKIKSTTRRRVFFLLGSTIGFLVAYFFAAGPGQDMAAPIVLNWTSYLDEQLGMSEMDWRSLLPDNIMVDDLFRNFTGRIFPAKASPGPSKDSPGAKLRAAVGTLTMFRSVLTDRDCWLRCLKLDEATGLDPPGFKLRAAQGLDAADYFVTGYWVWGKLIENFAVVGYDNNNMHLAAYDWRLTFDNLERRDNYFSKLKNTLELSKRHSTEKAVVLTHSMGGLIWYYFLKWVEAEPGGNGGPRWVEDHIHATVNIAGAMLGAPKTVPTLLSGEQRETVQPMAQYVLERFFSRKERARLFRSWGGVWSLLPRGGDVIWGGHHFAADDRPQSNQDTYGEMLRLESPIGDGGKHLERNLRKSYSFGAARSDAELRNHDPVAWSNPLETSLPEAPSMTFYCLYGHGLETERGYQLHETADLEALDDTGLPYVVDGGANDPTLKLTSGVKAVNGDGSVPLLSLGYMCVEGWKKRRFNPSGLKVITREFNHSVVPIYEDIRGGPDTGDHVDILGNTALTEDVLRIATSWGDDLGDRIRSDIREIASRVAL
ncbi:phospholipid:diacylglycerol acyltransferase [Massospora cicadina]|nr:phospholipid:diacylglycerol acyltransferase [Massospora cicadina]